MKKMMKKRVLVLVVIIAAMSMSVQADVYNWTGAADNDVFNELNWELDGSPGTNIEQIDPAIAVNHDLVIASGTPEVSGANFAAPLQLGEDQGSLTITGGFLDGTVPAGNNGVRAGGATGVFIHSNMAMSGDSIVNMMFLLDLDLTLADSAELILNGGGNPINDTLIDITSLDASIYCTAETVTAFTNEHLSKILVNGSAAEIGVNLSVISDGAAGSIVSAIPEPATMLLFGLGGMFLRRKKA